jgi:2-C-methyl-D-erythritol 2,4-cyclodiphosphate synthase
MKLRIGHGIDFHRLEKGREFWLGGVLVPHHSGAVGHSDADVLLHAICDALLGAAALGDIGKHFPDTDPQYKGIDSKILLKHTVGLIKAQGYTITNLDTMLCLEEPKIKSHIEAMQAAISDCTGLSIDEISIKATTTEKLGFVGREEGVFAHATTLLIKE